MVQIIVLSVAFPLYARCHLLGATPESHRVEAQAALGVLGLYSCLYIFAHSCQHEYLGVLRSRHNTCQAATVCTDSCIDMYIDMRMHMRLEMCMDILIDMLIDIVPHIF